MKPKKIISLLLVLVLTLTACSSRTVPEDSSDVSDPTQENANHISHVSATGSTDYTTFIDMCIPNIISVLGEDHGVRIDAILMNYIIVYKLDGDDNRVEFETTAMSDDALSIDEVITDSAIISDTISFYGTVDITGTGLLSSMDIDEAISWCKENNYIYESGSGDNGLETWTYLRINYKGIEVYYEWKDDSIPVVRVISSSYGAPPTETLENQTPGYDPDTWDAGQFDDPYFDTTEFEYKKMVYCNGTIETDDILRDINSYIGTSCTVKGRVAYVSSLTDENMSFLIEISTSNETYCIRCTSTTHIPIIVGDQIVVWGEIAGLAQYQLTNQYGRESTHDTYSLAVRYYVVNPVTQKGVQFTDEEREFFFNHTYEATGSGFWNDPLDKWDLEYFPQFVNLTDSTINGYPYTILEGSIERDPSNGSLVMTIVYPAPTYCVSDFQRRVHLYLDGRLIFSPGAKLNEYDEYNTPRRRDETPYYEGYTPEDAIVNEEYVSAMPAEFWRVWYSKAS